MKLDKFYIYEGSTPVGIVDNADKMKICDIERLVRALKLCFNRDLVVKPIYAGDFAFDPETGRKLDRIDTFVYPEFKRQNNSNHLGGFGPRPGDSFKH